MASKFYTRTLSPCLMLLLFFDCTISKHRTFEDINFPVPSFLTNLKGVNVESPILLEKSAIKFLLDLDDNTLSNEKNSVNYNDLTSEKVFGKNGSDIIKTFIAYQYPGEADENTPGNYKLHFDVPNMEEDEYLTAAQLRVYRKLPYNRVNDKKFVINIYQLESNKDNNEEVKHLVESRNIPLSYEGWITFDISSIFQCWLNHPITDFNFRLQLTTMTYDDSTFSTKPNEIGIVDVSGDSKLQPFIVMFSEISNNHEYREELITERVKRSSADDDSRNSKSSKNDCKVQPLYVNFKDIGYTSIIKPKGIDIGYCRGNCKLSKRKFDKFIFHKHILQVVRYTKDKTIPKPCCVPTRLSKISIVFLHNMKTAIKLKLDIVVNECECR